MDRGLDALSLDDTLAFVRGFMLFSMLANLAEDRQGGLNESGEDVATAPRASRGEGYWHRAGGSSAGCGAHRSRTDGASHRGHAQEHDRSSQPHRRADATPGSRSHGSADRRLHRGALLRQIALLWQTRPLRRERLYVADEVAIALTYLRDVFLPVLPMLYGRWERALAHRPKSFLRLGSWIGGDRDGNPNVNAESLHLALGRASQAALETYLEQLHALGASFPSRRAGESHSRGREDWRPRAAM